MLLALSGRAVAAGTGRAALRVSRWVAFVVPALPGFFLARTLELATRALVAHDATHVGGLIRGRAGACG